MNRAVELVVVTWITVCALGAGIGSAADVEMAILRPDGKPAAKATVEIASAERTHGREESPQAKVTTNDQGMARFDWPEGVWRMDVRATGVGYTASGLVEVLAGRKNTVPLPALAPFGRITGKLPEQARGENAVVKISRHFAWPEDDIAIKPVNGRFSADLRSGRYWVSVSDGKRCLAQAGQIAVTPGETIAGVLFKPVAPENQVPRTIRRRGPGQGQRVAWVQGTVHDEAGRPVQGATVYACATYFGGLRMYEMLSKAVSDEKGRYEIQGEGGLASFSASLVTHVPGRPNAWSWLSRDDFEGEWVEEESARPTKKPGRAPTIDIAIPQRGGTLEAKVQRDGKPARGVWVSISLEGVNLRDIWAAGGDKEREELNAIVESVVRTGEDGVARFENLLPGRYRVIAAAGDTRLAELRNGWGIGSQEAKRTTAGTAEGVSVRVGQTTTHRLAICSLPDRTEMQVSKVGGEPLAMESVAFEYGSFAGSGWSTSLKLDSSGRGNMHFESAGLWHIEFKYRDSPTRWFPVRDLFSAAQAVVAVSPLLEFQEPVRMRALRFEPGTILAELRDPRGRPLSGIVELGHEVLDFGWVMIGSTNEKGAVRFTGVPSGKYVLRAYVPEKSPPNLASLGQPVASEESLRDRQVVPWTPIEPKFNTEQGAVLRLRSVGYVLGTLKPARGKKASDYTVYLDETATKQGAEVRYDPEKGVFAAGPFLLGKVKLAAFDQTDPRQPAKCGEFEASVEPGKVTQTTISASETLVRPLAHAGSALVGMGGVSMLGGGAEKLAGRVMLPDGKTPALAARVMYFEPGQWQARLAGMADASGTLHPRGVWYSGNATDAQPPKYPDQPVAVAWLPGCYGDVIQPVVEGKAIEWVLPEPKVLRGTVSVGGKPPGPRGQIRVVAAYQGKGALAGVLSVQATAQADGLFELAGLTKGTYQVQAALDNIWLSPTLEVKVDQGDPPPVKLAIGAPAGPMVVKLTDAHGQPLCGREVTLQRPGGPLESLWPRVLLSDGAGEVHIPALEAGTHKLRVVETGVEREIKAEALPAQLHGV